MKKAEIIDELASKTGLNKKSAQSFLDAFIDIVGEVLSKGGEVELTGFGKFSVSEKAAREGRNPATGAVIQIPATKTPKFKAGKVLKERVK